MPSIRSIASSEDEDSDSCDEIDEIKRQRSNTASASEELVYDDEHPNIVLTGPGKRTPILVFRADYLVNKELGVRQVGDKYHLSYILTRGDCKIVRSIFHAHGMHESHPNSPDFNIMWTSSQVKPYVLRSLTEFQRINHFPRSYEITRKDRLFKNIQRMQQVKGVRHFDIVPPSFVLPGEFQEFCATFLKDKGPYIVKPIALSRGRGIYLCNHPEQIQLDEQLIVCKYIANPFLIDGFKFDIRLYVAVTSYDPLIIYLYEEGLARFATMKYDPNPKTLRHQCMHLTNYSINKRNENFVQNDDADVEDYGNKWSLGALLRYLKSIGKDVTVLMMRIEDVIIKAIMSVELPISTACKMFQPFRGNCFELYGFDIILDETLRPWLLEVNLSPSLACDAPIDFKIKSHMVCDLLTLVGLPCHDPVLRVPHNSRRNRDGKNSTPGSRPNTGPHSVGPIAARPPSVPKPQSSTKRSTSSNGSVLTAEEVKMIRRAKEEYARRAGWTRIFPTKDTWDIYSSFFQSSNSSNFLLHQKLFSDSSTTSNSNSRASSGGSSTATRTAAGHSLTNNSSTVVSKTKIPLHSLSLSSLSVSLSSSADHHKRVAGVYESTNERMAYYERRLGTPLPLTRSHSLPARRRPPELCDTGGKVDPSCSVFRGNLLKSDDCDPQSDSEAGDHSSSSVKDSFSIPNTPSEKSRPSDKDKFPKSNSLTRASSADCVSEPNDEDMESHRKRAFVEERNDIGDNGILGASNGRSSSMSNLSTTVVPSDLIKQGGEMSKLQARYTFGAYLSRVQQRLMLESRCNTRISADEQRQACDQIDLVLRFLRRASENLHQEFRVQIPSRKLPLNQRKRILSKMLSDFINIYAKETEHMKSQLRSADGGKGLNHNDFKDFLRTASENELESILTTYTHANKSAGIFINAHQGQASNFDQPRLTRTSSMDSGVFIRDDSGEGGHGGHQADMLDYNAAAIALRASPSRQSMHSAALAYSTRLTRPSSALTLRSSSNRPQSRNRPSSASMSRQERIPVVDTYDEAAINEALQKLAVKQQARQYAASKVSSILKQHTNPVRHEHAMKAAPYSYHQYQSSINAAGDGESQVSQKGSDPGDAAGPSVQTLTDTYVPERQRTQTVQPEAKVRRNSATDLRKRMSADLAERIRLEFATRPPSRQRELASSQSLLHQFRQSKALLEQSRAKHDAMLAQVDNGNSGSASAFTSSGLNLGASATTKRPKPPPGPKPTSNNSVSSASSSHHSRSAVVRLNTGLQQSSPPMLRLTFASNLNSNTRF